MGGVLAAGVPAWPAAGGGFDLSPLLMIGAMIGGAILVARFLFQMTLTRRVVGSLVLGGTLAWGLADITGLLPGGAIGLLLLSVVSVPVRRAQAG